MSSHEIVAAFTYFVNQAHIHVLRNFFQVSWTDEVKKTHTGDYNINLYDEESYAAIRKAQRNEEDTSNIKPLAVVVVNNPGVFLGPWVNSELLATLLAVVISYFAFSAKSKILA